MTTATEYKIKAMYQTLENLKRESKSIKSEPNLPWRENEDWVDRVSECKKAIHEIEDDIITLEYELRDPEQDAEIRAEINAAIYMSGNSNDRAEWYMHSPMEEERFQEQIQHDLRYGYYDSDGYFEEGYDSGGGPFECGTCNNTIWEDDVRHIEGHDTCSVCSEEALGWLKFVASFAPNYVVEEARWETEHYLSERESLGVG